MHGFCAILNIISHDHYTLKQSKRKAEGSYLMFYNKWMLGIGATLIILCGCSQKVDDASASANGSVQEEQYTETDAAREASVTEGENTFPEIIVIDTLPEVDETIPREQTPLPSSEIMNMIGQKNIRQRIWWEDGTFSDELLSVHHVVCHDHDVSFAMPEDGQISWMGSGVSVQYIGEREREVLRKLDEKNVVGDDCKEFNESMAKTRQLIAEGFLQDEFVKYLSKFPELQLEGRELTLELFRAGRTDRIEDGTSWWELDYSLTTKLEDGSSIILATMDITRVFLVEGEENTWDDTHYRIWGNPSAMWELLEQPAEDRGETFLTVLPEGTFTDEESIHDYMEQYARERKITWEYSRESSFWYDYLVWQGEGGGYQYRVAVPITDERTGNWLIQAVIKEGAEKPEDCFNALAVFMHTFHGNPYCYRVKEGDTLYGIAGTYLGDGSNYPCLAERNGIADPDFISIGQLIEIPVDK